MKAAKRMAVGESLRLAACAGWRGLGKEVQLRVTPMTSPQKVPEGALVLSSESGLHIVAPRVERCGAARAWRGAGHTVRCLANAGWATAAVHV